MEGSDSMAPAVLPDRRLTYDDFRLFPDDARLRHEIIGNFLATHPDIGRVFLAPVDVVLSFHDIAAPDFVFEASNQLAIMTEKNADEDPHSGPAGQLPVTRRWR
jgi:hypothetical protein